jgi:nicotinate-nucleotide adenylyltransferase
MRLGIFGGSFDPVHYGHLLLAEAVREQCSLDAMWFVPAAMPPHKRGRRLTPGSARVEMLQLAIAGHEKFHVSTVELDRGGVSFTVDTLVAIQDQQPSATMYLPMGADTLQDLPNWHAPDRICQLAIPVVVRRMGAPEPRLDVLAKLVAGERLAEIKEHQVEMPLFGVSSSDIRRRLEQQRSIRFQTPRAVEQFINAKRLYAGT